MDLITAGAAQAIFLGVIVFFAGIVRGCIGFGFSALVVVSATQFVEPTQIVPLVVLLEIAASVQMALRAWRDVRWDTLGFLLAGVVVGTPIGIWVLAAAPAPTVRLVLSLLILSMTIVLGAGYVYRGPMSRPVLSGVGVVSGVFNGIAAIGGMPVAIFLTSAELPIRAVRATMVVFFLCTELAFLISGVVGNLYHSAIINTFLLATVPMAIGLALGGRLFGRLDERMLRRMVLAVLFALATVGVLRAMFQL